MKATVGQPEKRRKKTGWGMEKVKQEGGKTDLKGGGKAFKTFPKVSSFLFKNLSLSLGTIL